MSAEPKIVWTFPAIAFCAGCNAPAPINFEGREYLLSFAGRPGVCSAACAPTAAGRVMKSLPLNGGGKVGARDPREPSKTRARTDRATSSYQIDRARRAGRAAVVLHMAEFIVQRAAGQQSCTRDHLIEAGYAADEIAALGAQAVAHAATIAPNLRGEGAAA
jgi:hypothetical protein